MTDYETCNWCKFKHDCAHKVPYPVKEKRMNLYTITARKISSVEFVEVEAENEDEAIRMAERGDVDPDYDEFEEYEDFEITDVQYGDKEYYAYLGCNFVVRGVEDIGPKLTDALYSLLAQFDGKTVQYDNGELELVGFSVDRAEEA